MVIIVIRNLVFWGISSGLETILQAGNIDFRAIIPSGFHKRHASGLLRVVAHRMEYYQA